jgi:hypothetical protein
MFLDIPHRVTTYFGDVVKHYVEVEDEEPKIFNSKHLPMPYYTSALALYRLESMFRSKAIDSKYQKIKFFILMVFRRLVNSENLPIDKMNSERLRAVDIIETSGVNINDKQALKNASFTEQILENYGKVVNK